MSFTNRERMSLAEWQGIVETLQEVLEGTLMGLNFGQREAIRPDILALEAFDELDKYLQTIKRDLGV